MRALAATALLLFLGCAQRTLSAKDRGEQLFSDPKLSSSQFNSYSCATCHTRTASPGIAVSLANSVHRRRYWGGYEQRLIDATNDCLVDFMRGTALDAANPDGRALFEYLNSISPDDPAADEPMTVVENVAQVQRGDAGHGKDVYATSCRSCHGEPHTGEGQLSDLVSIVPEASQDFARNINADPGLVVIEKVRHGAFFGIGGTMPPFRRESLSDEDLGAVLSYLGL